MISTTQEHQILKGYTQTGLFMVKIYACKYYQKYKLIESIQEKPFVQLYP